MIALTSCGGADDPESETTSSPTAEENTETGSSSPSPSPSPTEAELPEAADGVDYDACFDGECEVLVTEPVDIALDPALEVQATTASITEMDGWRIGVEFSDGGQTIGLVTWFEMRDNGSRRPIYSTFDGASITFSKSESYTIVGTLGGCSAGRRQVREGIAGFPPAIGTWWPTFPKS